MTAKTLEERLEDVRTSVRGLRLEVEGYRQHVGSSTEFILLEIDRLIGLISEQLASERARLAAKNDSANS